MSDLISKELISEIGNQIEPNECRMSRDERESFERIIRDITSKTVQAKKQTDNNEKLSILVRLYGIIENASKEKREEVYKKIQELM